VQGEYGNQKREIRFKPQLILTIYQLAGFNNLKGFGNFRGAFLGGPQEPGWGWGKFGGTFGGINYMGNFGRFKISPPKHLRARYGEGLGFSQGGAPEGFFCGARENLGGGGETGGGGCLGGRGGR